MRQETLNIRCKLTDDEMIDLSKQMSDHINKKKQAEDNLAEMRAQITATIKGHDAIINKLATVINAGAEFRNVMCDVIVSESANTVSWVRTDTGDIVNTERPIPNRYLQMEAEL